MRASSSGSRSNPSPVGTLNAWLHNNQGYVCVDGDCDNLVLDAPNRIVPGRVSFISEVEKPTYATMKANIIASNPVMIAHVRCSYIRD